MQKDMNPVESNTNLTLNHLPEFEEFEDMAKQLLDFSERTQAKAVLLFISFDDLVNEINSKQENSALDAISERLLSKARESDIYAHISQMSFANLTIATSEEHTAILIEKLKNELARPIQLSDGASIRLNAKIGYAEFPVDGSDITKLLATAKSQAQH